MKVCIITTSYPRYAGDAAGIFIQKLVTALNAIAVNGWVVAPADAEGNEKDTEGQFQIHRTRYLGGTLAYGLGIFPNLAKSPWKIFQIPFMLGSMLVAGVRHAREADVIHGQWLISGFIACIVSAVTKKPFMVSVRGQDTRLLDIPVVGHLFRLVLRRASIVHAVSVGMKAKLSEKIPSEKIVCIFNGVDEMPAIAREQREAFLIKYGLTDSEKYLVYLGRRISIKGVERLFPLLSISTFEKYVLLCFGHGEKEFDDDLIQRMRIQGVADRVRLFPEVSPAEVPSAISIAQFIVSGSYSEGRPNSLLEGLSAGKPCIVSAIDAHQELADACPAVITFKDDSDQDFAAKLTGLNYQALSDSARSYAAQFSWQACAEGIKSQYQKMSGR